MKCFVVGIKKGNRHAVFAALSGTQTKAARNVLARNTGWEVEFVKLKQAATVFRIHDDAWYEDEPAFSLSTEHCPKHRGMPWTRNITVRTCAGFKCPLCEDEEAASK